MSSYFHFSFSNSHSARSAVSREARSASGGVAAAVGNDALAHETVDIGAERDFHWMLAIGARTQAAMAACQARSDLALPRAGRLTSQDQGGAR